MTDKTHVRNVLETARKAGFVRTHHDGGNGVTQFNHTNGNVLFVHFQEDAFAEASGHGWGDAPWTDTPWDTYDYGTFVAEITA
jgi:hypothetical protein